MNGQIGLASTASPSPRGTAMNAAPPTLILTRSRIAELARTQDYLLAMESAFRGLAAGRYTLPAVGHLQARDGAFHVKSAVRPDAPPLAVVKVNANFPGNPAFHGLPTIQGFIVLLDAERGCVLAFMDSIEITARRTAATTALAARYLARKSSVSLGIVGCGLQALYHLDALLDVAQLQSVKFCDPRDSAAEAFQGRALELGLHAERMVDPRSVARGADIVVTVTTSTRAILGAGDPVPGAFVAGVGADNPAKHELAPELLASSRVIVDSLSQAAAGGDLAHAIKSGVMKPDAVYAELADIVTGRVPGRPDDDRCTVFGSTGLAVQDHAAAAMVFERACQQPGVPALRLDDIFIAS